MDDLIIDENAREILWSSKTTSLRRLFQIILEDDSPIRPTEDSFPPSLCFFWICAQQSTAHFPPHKVLALLTNPPKDQKEPTPQQVTKFLTTWFGNRNLFDLPLPEFEKTLKPWLFEKHKKSPLPLNSLFLAYFFPNSHKSWPKLCPLATSALFDPKCPLHSSVFSVNVTSIIFSFYLFLQEPQQDQFWILSSPPPEPISKKKSLGSKKPKKPVIVDFMGCSIRDFAIQLTGGDLDCFMQLTPHDFSTVGKGKENGTTALLALAKRVDYTFTWVRSVILSYEDKKKRAQALENFILLADKLLSMGNIYSMKSVVTALESTPIHRLSETWAKVSPPILKEWFKLQALVDVSKSHAKLRAHYEANPVILPYMFCLVDLIFIYEAWVFSARDEDDDTHAGVDHPINLWKFKKGTQVLCQTCRHIRLFSEQFKYFPNKQIIDMMENSKIPILNEEKSYRKSNEIQPKKK